MPSPLVSCTTLHNNIPDRDTLMNESLHDCVLSAYTSHKAIRIVHTKLVFTLWRSRHDYNILVHLERLAVIVYLTLLLMIIILLLFLCDTCAEKVKAEERGKRGLPAPSSSLARPPRSPQSNQVSWSPSNRYINWSSDYSVTIPVHILRMMKKPPLWKVLGPLVVVVPYCAWVLNDRFSDDNVKREIKREQRRAEIVAARSDGAEGSESK